MNQFINNIINLGFWNIVLISFVFAMIREVINYGYMVIERVLKIEHTTRWYDVITYFILLVLFIYTIYSYKGN